MTDHIHPLPVCGSGQHKPHAPQCTGFGETRQCVEIQDSHDPNYRKALCRHDHPRDVDEKPETLD